MICVQGCAQRDVAHFVNGDYKWLPSDQHHVACLYAKDMDVDGVSALIYFWDGAHGYPAGWYFGNAAGGSVLGDSIFAYHPDALKQLPPVRGWRVPLNGPADPHMVVRWIDTSVPLDQGTSSVPPVARNHPGQRWNRCRQQQELEAGNGMDSSCPGGASFDDLARQQQELEAENGVDSSCPGVASFDDLDQRQAAGGRPSRRWRKASCVREVPCCTTEQQLNDKQTTTTGCQAATHQQANNNQVATKQEARDKVTRAKRGQVAPTKQQPGNKQGVEVPAPRRGREATEVPGSRSSLADWPESPPIQGESRHAGKPPRGAGIIAFREGHSVRGATRPENYVCIVQKANGKSSFPKGGRRGAETLRDAAFREWHEECGIPGERLHLVHGLHVDEPEIGVRYLLARCVPCSDSSGPDPPTLGESTWKPPAEDKSDNDPIIKARWVSVERCLLSELSAVRRGLLRQALHGYSLQQ